MKDTTIRAMNRAKLVLAVLVLIADIMATAACVMGEFYPGVVTFILLGSITLDYIRIARAELKAGPWYELSNME